HDLLFTAQLPAGPACGGASCWAPLGSGSFVYRAPSSFPEGVTKAKVKAGTGGAARADAEGKGALLSNHPFPLPALPLPLPLRMQLHGPNGFCAEPLHDASSALRNDPAAGLFKARGVP